jgi:hypothetical protein
VQAGPGHDVRLCTPTPGNDLLHLRQPEKPQLAAFVIEEEIDVGSLCRRVARRRAEPIKVFDAEPPFNSASCCLSLVMASLRSTDTVWAQSSTHCMPGLPLIPSDSCGRRSRPFPRGGRKAQPRRAA